MANTSLGKSKSVLLINMCVAIILAYTLFLAGIKTAVVDKVSTNTSWHSNYTSIIVVKDNMTFYAFLDTSDSVQLFVRSTNE